MFFVGMMGTGKSTVARALADVMGRYIFLDTDTIIEELLGASVGEVFATDGEEAFRSVESQVLDQVGLVICLFFEENTRNSDTGGEVLSNALTRSLPGLSACLHIGLCTPPSGKNGRDRGGSWRHPFTFRVRVLVLGCGVVEVE